MMVDWIGYCCATRVIFDVGVSCTIEDQERVVNTIGQLKRENHSGGSHLVQLNLTHHQSRWFPFLESLGFTLVQKFYNGRYLRPSEGAALMHIWQLVVGDSILDSK